MKKKDMNNNNNEEHIMKEKGTYKNIKENKKKTNTNKKIEKQ